MTTNEQLYERMGALRAMVQEFREDAAELKETIRAMRAEASDREARASDSRRALYDTVNSVRNEVSEVKADIAEVRNELGDVRKTAASAKEVTDKLAQWEQRGKGVAAVLSLLGVGTGAVLFDPVRNFIAWLRTHLGL